mgnify:CR=1 FL=1
MKTKIWLVSILVISLILLSGCQRKLKISDEVTFSYTWYFSDGLLFETGEKTIILWSGEAPTFMEKSLMNEKWDKQIKLEVEPVDAYWPLYDSWKLQKISRFVFDKIFTWFKIWEKKTIAKLEWVIKWTEIMDGDEYVLFEMNPRQTWDTLKYEIQILDK